MPRLVVLLSIPLLKAPPTRLQWGIGLCLEVDNSAFAFTLWNRTMQVLSASESTMINNTMLVQIAVLAWLFLGERPGLKEIAGKLIVLVSKTLKTRKTEKINSFIIWYSIAD